MTQRHPTGPPSPIASRPGWVLLLTALSLLGLGACRGTDLASLKGKPVEKPLAAGETHVYSVSLAAGEALRVVVEEEGLDLAVRLVGPDKKEVVHVDGPGNRREPEDLMVVAKESGPYRFEVALGAGALPGRYRLRTEGPRPATPADRLRAEAVQATQSAVDNMPTPTRESLLRQLGHRQRALALWRQLGDGERETETLYQLAIVHFLLNDLVGAATLHHQAAARWREPQDRWRRADALQRAGVAEHALKRLTDARRDFEQAFELAHALGERLIEANSLNGLAHLDLDAGEARVALDRSGAGLALVPKTAVSNDELVARSSLLINLGNAYTDLSEPQEARKSYLEALKITQGKNLKALKENRITALNNLGSLYTSLGDFDKAAENFQQVIGLETDPAHLATTLSGLGAVYNRLDHRPEAIAALEEALERSRSLSDREVRANALNNLAVVRLDGDQPALARDLCLQALTLADKVEIEGDLRQVLSEAYRLLGDRPAARGELRKALALAQRHQDLSREANAEFLQAKVERDAGNFDTALALVGQALAIVEQLRVRVVSPDLRAKYLASNQNYYQLQIEILMTRGRGRPGDADAVAALHASEKAHARSLLDLLNGADVRRGADSDLLARERRASNEVSQRENYRLKLQQTPGTPPRELDEAKLRVAAALEEYQQIEDEIRIHSPGYAALTQPKPVTLEQIQRELIDPHTVLLEYALGEPKSYLWAVTTTSVVPFELPARGKIEAAARDLYRLLTERNAKAGAVETPKQSRDRFTQADAAAEKASAVLGSMILGPAAEVLAGRRVLVVPDGVLQVIPFAALRVPSKAAVRGETSSDAHDVGEPLIVGHEVVTLPSASVLAVLRHEAAQRRPAPKTLAVLADPVFERQDLRFGEPADGDGGGQRGESSPASYHRLIGSGKEADAIASLVPREEQLVAKGFDASGALATSGELKQYRLVHFATHGRIDTEHPDLSELALSMFDRQGRPRTEGHLRLADIYNLDLNADLVVLSACKTALGKEVRGEGLIGLTRGFMYAGASRVVASLWNVEDQATRELMVSFYKGMIVDRLSPAAALRQAQVAMAASKLWAAPYYWAGFSLQGEWR